MTSRIVPLQVGDTELLVEVSAGNSSGGSEYTSKSPGQRLDETQEALTNTFDRAQDSIIAIAAQSANVLRRAGKEATAPDEFEVKFGLKFSTKGKVIVAEASAEATLEVRLVYRAHEKSTD